MSTRMKLAFSLYFLSGLLLAAFGFVYLLRPEFMPYHSVAVGMPWSEVSPNFKILIIALMRAVGGTVLILALAFFLILLVPFRQGAKWALWGLPILGLLQSAGSAYAMSHVALNTSASPPLWVALAGAILVVVAFALSIPARNKRAGA